VELLAVINLAGYYLRFLITVKNKKKENENGSQKEQFVGYSCTAPRIVASGDPQLSNIFLLTYLLMS
jgi:hypothetical protein